MEYFLLRQSENLIKPFQINLAETDITQEEAFIATGEIEDDTSVPDFFVVKRLFDHYFFLSDRCKTLIDTYTDEVEAVPVFLTDTKRQKQLCFWKVTVEEVDCLKWEKPMRYDNLTVIAEDTDHRFLFRIAFDRQEYLVVSLPLAEHMLRKNLYGIQYIPLQVEYEEE
jgi:hypothetical protein